MKIIAIAIKDMQRSLRSAFMIGICVAAPLLLTGLMYFAFGGMSKGSAGLPALKVGIANLDSLPADAPISVPLGVTVRSIFFDDSVKSWITASDYPDEASARQAVDGQQIGAAIIVPTNFTADFLAGSPSATITMLQDPTLTVTALIVRSMLTSLLDGISGGGIAYNTINERQQTLGIPADPKGISNALTKYQAWYAGFQRDLYHNPDQAVLKMSAPSMDQSRSEVGMAGVMKFIMAGQMIFFAFFTGGYSMLSILQEQEEGTLARMFTTPTSRTVDPGRKIPGRRADRDPARACLDVRLTFRLPGELGQSRRGGSGPVRAGDRRVRAGRADHRLRQDQPAGRCGAGRSAGSAWDDKRPVHHRGPGGCGALRQGFKIHPARLGAGRLAGSIERGSGQCSSAAFRSMPCDWIRHLCRWSRDVPPPVSLVEEKLSCVSLPLCLKI